MEKTGRMYLDALTKRYEAQISEALASLNLYTDKLSAIGEHSDLLEEQDKWLGKYSEAKGKLESLKSIYPNKLEKING